MAPSVARRSTFHCKLDSPLHLATVRSIFWVGGEWIMETPVSVVMGLIPDAQGHCKTA